MAVRAPEGKQGPIHVTMTTDVAQDLFLHWGVRKQGGGDWVAPPKVELMRLQMILLAGCLSKHLHILGFVSAPGASRAPSTSQTWLRDRKSNV